MKMLLDVISAIFGNTNEKIVKKLNMDVEIVNSFENSLSALSNEQLADKTREFRVRLAKGELLDSIMHEAFAVAREASKRAIGLRPFDVQIVGALALHKGKISEMKTGEGKTLVATMPVYLNALVLSGKWVAKAKEIYGENPENWEFKPFDKYTPVSKGVHVVTVNDYLAMRDANWMGPVYSLLGLDVGFVLTTSSHEERIKAYNSAVTYGTNNEFGFDYLRDNMVLNMKDRVQRELHYAIVDEVDSILIDEARTPLIISGPTDNVTDKYRVVNQIIPSFVKSQKNEITRTPDGKVVEPDGDFWIDEKGKTVYLTSQGIFKAEKLLNINNIYADINSDWIHHVTQALRAHYLFHKEVDYVVKDGKVMIVDEFTGRILDGRRWSEGLHQAVEAKEMVTIANENQTLATITFQNYFRMYDKLSGMTGTAETEAIEFKKIYNLEPVVIPTNKPIAREDKPDLVFPTEKGKFAALVKDIKQINSEGHPILIGTVSIEKSELLSKLLKKEGVKHNVLNAKQHTREAEIIAQAGRKGAVTIATNMAGRGTDIVLGGNATALMNALYKGVAPEDIDKEKYDKEYAEYKRVFEEEKGFVKNGHGLYVIGTERHESRRIDNQLRGRSARQGDPGVSVFYISLEDSLMRIFGNDSLKNAMMRYVDSEDQPISHSWISKSIERAQKRVEEYHFEIRKNLLEYDNVMNIQREKIYEIRTSLLKGENLRDDIFERIGIVIEFKACDYFENRRDHVEQWSFEEFNMEIKRIFGFDPAVTAGLLENMSNMNDILDKIIDYVENMAKGVYEKIEKSLPEDMLRHIERMILLQILDQKWKEQLRIIDTLRDGINLRGYAQRDPLVEFKRDSLSLFQNMLLKISENTLEFLFRIDQVRIGSPEQSRQPTARMVRQEKYNPFEDSRLSSSGGKPVDVKAEPIRKTVIAKPNEPCPCNSGKKYKICCGSKI